MLSQDISALPSLSRVARVHVPRRYREGNAREHSSDDYQPLGFAEGAQEKDREREHYFEIEATIREF